ncbi:hypothetical protein [Novosphingobium sp. JCM 18896]|uniref:hypothetical protein n=1 Tax=Novosphingobium sp. JCM 18896 TaxID=2989731 RepID=UPI002223A65C|nr:hypothetical protein [Novosphingobium sp. JCM 18896]
MTNLSDDNSPPWEQEVPNIESQSEGLIMRLRRVAKDCGDGANINDRITAIIAACIEEGIHGEGQIVAVLMGLGFNNRHVGAILNGHAGRNGAHHLWRKEPGKIYRLNEPGEVAPVICSTAEIKVPPLRHSKE